jgi:hypothetical protein
MKKLIVLFLAATVLSCSSEDHGNQEVVSSVETSAPILEGKVLSFKNEKSFVKEYSELSTLNKEQLQNWISDKKVIALLNTSSDSLAMQEDVIPQARLIYSDALKSILNAESKVKIGGKTLWLNERSFYLLQESEVNKSSRELIDVKDKLEVYGQLLGMSDPGKKITGKGLIPNENMSKTFISAEMGVYGTRHRHVVDIFNETIYFNGGVQTSKMYLRSTMQYRSCSSLRCTWKENFNARTLTTNFHCAACEQVSGRYVWSLKSNIPTTEVTGSQTYLLAEWQFVVPLANPHWNFAISGSITCTVVEHPMPVDVSWY